MKKRTRSRNSQKGSSSKSSKRNLKRARSSGDKSKDTPGPIALDETEEEREKRLAKRMALTLRAFRMTYDDHHSAIIRRRGNMPETLLPVPPGFAELSKAEQVKYLQSLWDQISERPDEIPVPESHLQLVENRLRQHREGSSSSQPAFEVIDRLLQKQK